MPDPSGFVRGAVQQAAHRHVGSRRKFCVWAMAGRKMKKRLILVKILVSLRYLVGLKFKRADFGDLILVNLVLSSFAT